jgi:hypothetical protein
MSARRPRGDKARVTIHVAVAPAVAFDVFTREIDLWWRRGPRFRAAGPHSGVLQFEPGVGGRLFETFEVDGAAQRVEVGRIKIWEPPGRLLFDWRNRNFAPHESTEVEVCFVATATGTEVTVEHRGWGSLRADHPARHGLEGLAFSGMIGTWWGELMTSLRHRLEERQG